MFTTTDVYTAASVIGQELQLLIDEHGSSDLETLMFKVINVLEQLEQCVNNSVELDEQISALHEKHRLLKDERSGYSESRDNYALNLEKLQQSWYQETQELLDDVTQLEAENQSLKTDLNCAGITADTAVSNLFEEASPRIVNTEEGVVKKTSKVAALVQSGGRPRSLKSPPCLDEVFSRTEKRLNLSKKEDRTTDLQLIRYLKIGAAEQASEVRSLRKQILQTDAYIDAAEEEVTRLARQSGSILAKCAPRRRHTDQLASEKTDLETQLYLCEKELKKLSLAANLFSTTIQMTDSVNSNLPLHISPCLGVESAESRPRPSAASLSAGDQNQPEDDSLLSLEELRGLFYERNELRCRLIELKSKLDALKDGEGEESLFGPLPMEPMEKLRPGFSVTRHGIKSMFVDLLHKIAEKSDA